MSFQDSTATPPDGRHALVEAQVMAGAIDALVAKLLEECVDKSSHTLEAIRACCQRIEAAVGPILDVQPAGVRHG